MAILEPSENCRIVWTELSRRGTQKRSCARHPRLQQAPLSTLPGHYKVNLEELGVRGKPLSVGDHLLPQPFVQEAAAPAFHLPGTGFTSPGENLLSRSTLDPAVQREKRDLVGDDEGNLTSSSGLTTASCTTSPLLTDCRGCESSSIASLALAKARATLC